MKKTLLPVREPTRFSIVIKGENINQIIKFNELGI